MYNVSAHQIPQYYQPQWIPFNVLNCFSHVIYAPQSSTDNQKFCLVFVETNNYKLFDLFLRFCVENYHVDYFKFWFYGTSTIVG